MNLLTFNCIVRSSHGPAVVRLRYEFDRSPSERFVCRSCAQSLERIMQDFNSDRLTQFIVEELEKV